MLEEEAARTICIACMKKQEEAARNICNAWTWMQCNWCMKWEKCCHFVDVGANILCVPCHEREWPPHAEYLDKLFRAKFGKSGAVEVLDIIARFAYPVIEKERELEEMRKWWYHNFL